MTKKKEITLVVLKPDACKKGVQKEIITRYKEAGLEVFEQKPTHFSELQAEQFYKEHQGRPYYEGLILATISGECLVLRMEGEDAIQQVRTLHGSVKDPAESTIRHDFPSAGGPFNMVHASDSEEAYLRECRIIFEDC